MVQTQSCFSHSRALRVCLLVAFSRSHPREFYIRHMISPPMTLPQKAFRPESCAFLRLRERAEEVPTSPTEPQSGYRHTDLPLAATRMGCGPNDTYLNDVALPDLQLSSDTQTISLDSIQHQNCTVQWRSTQLVANSWAFESGLSHTSHVSLLQTYLWLRDVGGTPDREG